MDFIRSNPIDDEVFSPWARLSKPFLNETAHAGDGVNLEYVDDGAGELMYESTT